MIAEYKANARKSIGRLTGWQRFSIGIGVVGLALLLVIWLLPSIFKSPKNGNLRLIHS